jgi:hypothetical protein
VEWLKKLPLRVLLVFLRIFSLMRLAPEGSRGSLNYLSVVGRRHRQT